MLPEAVKLQNYKKNKHHKHAPNTVFLNIVFFVFVFFKSLLTENIDILIAFLSMFIKSSDVQLMKKLVILVGSFL